MATTKQRRAFDKLVENRGNVSRAMLDAGYDPVTAKNPKNLTDSKAFREICEEYGLTDKLLLESLVEDIKQKPQKRLGELALASDILQRRKPENDGFTFNAPVQIIIKKHGE